MTAKHSHPRRSNTGLIFAGITAVAFLGVAALCLLAQVQRNTAVAKLRSAPGFVRVTEAVAQPKRPAQPPDSAPASVTPLPDVTAVLERMQYLHQQNETWKDVNRVFGLSTAKDSDQEWAELQAYLWNNRDLVEQIMALAAAGQPWYELDFSQGWALEVGHLAPMRSMARLLAVQCAYDMHAGNTDTALDHLNGIYQLGQILEHEPVMVSQLVRIAIHGIGVGAVGSLLSPGELTPQQVRQVTSMLRQMDYRQGVADSLWGETQAGLSSFDAMRAGDLRPELIGLHGTDRGDRLFQHLYSSPLGRPWLNLDEAAYAEVMGQMTQAAPAANFYEAIPALQAIRNEIEALPRTRVFTRALTPALTVYLEAPARATAQNELAQIGLTLELQYHGQAAYPADLYEIESAFGSPLPLDPYSGQPYRYEQLATGFLLYSIGSNLQDDGGRHIPRVLEGDIVWRGAP